MTGALQGQRTPLYDLHQSHGAKFFDFAGYQMPVQYPRGIKAEHLTTRAHAGLFDVSHMGQALLSGAGACRALERLVPMDIIDLPVGRQRYALFTAADGGILDDLMVAKIAPETLHLIVNAARKAHDFALLQQLGNECNMQPLADRALLALQGPSAEQVLSDLAPAVKTMRFMDVKTLSLLGVDCLVARSGYSGEDGFEISVPQASATELAEHLLSDDQVALIGLGARDSLRLEAGLCLYGHDIDSATTPAMANLNWAIQKVRRIDGARAGGFPGAERILSEFAKPPARLRVGLAPVGKAPIRAATDVLNEEGQLVGVVTSGGFGPSVGAPVAMGYVTRNCAAPGTPLLASVRSRQLPVTVCKLPFIEPRFRR